MNAATAIAACHIGVITKGNVAPSLSSLNAPEGRAGQF
jgi:hypothetical protein